MHVHTYIHIMHTMHAIDCYQILLLLLNSEITSNICRCVLYREPFKNSPRFLRRIRPQKKWITGLQSWQIQMNARIMQECLKIRRFEKLNF